MVDLAEAGRNEREHPIAEPTPVAALSHRATQWCRRRRALTVALPLAAVLTGVAIVASTRRGPHPLRVIAAPTTSAATPVTLPDCTHRQARSRSTTAVPVSGRPPAGGGGAWHRVVLGRPRQGGPRRGRPAPWPVVLRVLGPGRRPSGRVARADRPECGHGGRVPSVLADRAPAGSWWSAPPGRSTRPASLRCLTTITSSPTARATGAHPDGAPPLPRCGRARVRGGAADRVPQTGTPRGVARARRSRSVDRPAPGCP